MRRNDIQTQTERKGGDGSGSSSGEGNDAEGNMKVDGLLLTVFLLLWDKEGREEKIETKRKHNLRGICTRSSLYRFFFLFLRAWPVLC